LRGQLDIAMRNKERSGTEQKVRFGDPPTKWERGSRRPVLHGTDCFYLLAPKGKRGGTVRLKDHKKKGGRGSKLLTGSSPEGKNGWKKKMSGKSAKGGKKGDGKKLVIGKGAGGEKKGWDLENEARITEGRELKVKRGSCRPVGGTRWGHFRKEKKGKSAPQKKRGGAGTPVQPRDGRDFAERKNQELWVKVKQGKIVGHPKRSPSFLGKGGGGMGGRGGGGKESPLAPPEGGKTGHSRREENTSTTFAKTPETEGGEGGNPEKRLDPCEAVKHKKQKGRRKKRRR